MLEEFLELFLSDEIVFLVVEHGHENVEVRQQLVFKISKEGEARAPRTQPTQFRQEIQTIRS